MRAWVFVPSGPHHAVIWQSGAVTMRDIPPGNYKLHSWTPAAGENTRTLSLKPGETLALRVANP